MSLILSPLQRYRGCLLGGAAGDALGAPVEFMSFTQILDHFGPGGIRDLAPAYGRVGAITDDTQMTLFTAEGLIRSHVRYAHRGICGVPGVVHRAYMRWLRTQGHEPFVKPEDFWDQWPMDGWLIGIQELWAARAPGNTCLSALRTATGTGKMPSNNSKGCGGIMRAAPVGLVADRESAFGLGVETATLTHGHPSGYLAAGVLALLIAELISGSSLKDAVRAAKLTLVTQPQHDEVLVALEAAEMLAASGPSQSSVGRLGGGWVAEEALAIAVYSALAARNFEEAVVLAVNHSGDSDSTGAIAGNICGAIYGDTAIPARWTDVLELREEIAVIAEDLIRVREDTLDCEDAYTLERYPGW